MYYTKTPFDFSRNCGFNLYSMCMFFVELENVRAISFDIIRLCFIGIFVCKCTETFWNGYRNEVGSKWQWINWTFKQTYLKGNVFKKKCIWKEMYVRPLFKHCPNYHNFLNGRMFSEKELNVSLFFCQSCWCNVRYKIEFKSGLNKSIADIWFEQEWNTCIIFEKKLRGTEKLTNTCFFTY